MYQWKPFLLLCTCWFFQFLCLSCFCYSLVKSSFFLAHLLPHWLDILFIALVHFWAWRRTNQLCSPPLLSRAVFYGIVPSTSLKLGCDPLSPQDPELCHLLVITVKAAPDLYISDWLFLSMSTVSFWLPVGMLCVLGCCVCWDAILNAILGGFPHYIAPSEDIWDFFQLSEGLQLCRLSHMPRRLPADAYRPVFLLFFTLYSSSERHPDVMISQEVYEIFPLMPGGNFSSLRQQKPQVISNVCNFTGLLQIQRIMTHWLSVQTPSDVPLRAHCPACRKKVPDLILINLERVV